VFKLDEKAKKKILKKLDEALSSLKLAGIKGETLYAHLDRWWENIEFKIVEKDMIKMQKALEKFDKDIELHMVVKAEKEDEIELEKAMKEFTRLYLQLHILHLFEREEIRELRKIVDTKRYFKGNDAATEQIKRLVTRLIDEWQKELENERKMINAVWARAKGHMGAALTLTKAMKSGEGYLKAFSERLLLRRTLRQNYLAEKNIAKLRKVKTLDELKKEIDDIAVEEAYSIEGFKKLWQFLDITWEEVAQNIDTLVERIYKAVEGYELPQDDKLFAAQIRERIVTKLEEPFLHGLREEIKQLEGELGSVQ
jgi:hypothetical protein